MFMKFIKLDVMFYNYDMLKSENAVCDLRNFSIIETYEYYGSKYK